MLIGKSYMPSDLRAFGEFVQPYLYYSKYPLCNQSIGMCNAQSATVKVYFTNATEPSDLNVYCSSENTNGDKLILSEQIIWSTVDILSLNEKGPGAYVSFSMDLPSKGRVYRSNMGSGDGGVDGGWISMYHESIDGSSEEIYGHEILESGRIVVYAGPYANNNTMSGPGYVTGYHQICVFFEPEKDGFN